MEELKVVKINKGKAYHIAHQVETAYVGKDWSTKCNSVGGSNWGKQPRITVTSLEVTKENVTCKKCLKAYFGE